MSPVPTETSRFDDDYARCARRGFDIAALDAVIRALIDGKQLPDAYDDHPLRGGWGGCRECHIESDWLLVYRKSGATVTFLRTGTHAEIFA
jgi:mRNA interferase YafQ